MYDCLYKTLSIQEIFNPRFYCIYCTLCLRRVCIKQVVHIYPQILYLWIWLKVCLMDSGPNWILQSHSTALITSSGLSEAHSSCILVALWVSEWLLWLKNNTTVFFLWYFFLWFFSCAFKGILASIGLPWASESLKRHKKSLLISQGKLKIGVFFVLFVFCHSDDSQSRRSHTHLVAFGRFKEAQTMNFLIHGFG